MLTSKKFKMISCLVKAIANFIGEVGEISKVAEDDQAIIHVHKDDVHRIADKIKDIGFLLEAELTKYPNNKRLKEIKNRLDDVRLDGNSVLKKSMINH